MRTLFIRCIVIYVVLFSVFTLGTKAGFAQDEDRQRPKSLFEAIDDDDWPVVHQLLTSGVDVNVRDKLGRTPIYRTLTPIPKPNILLSLLDSASPDISLLADDGLNVIQFAESLTKNIGKNPTPKEKLLKSCLEELKAYQELKRFDHKDWNFYDICKSGSVEDVKTIFEKGVLVNLPNVNGLTPMAFALNNKDISIFNFLARNGGVLPQDSRYEYEVVGPEDRAHRDKQAARLNKQTEQLSEFQGKLTFSYWIIAAMSTVTVVSLGCCFVKKKRGISKPPTEPQPRSNTDTKVVTIGTEDIQIGGPKIDTKTAEPPVPPKQPEQPPEPARQIYKFRDALREANDAIVRECILDNEPLCMPNDTPVLVHLFQPNRAMAESLLNFLKTVVQERRPEGNDPDFLLKCAITIIERCDLPQDTEKVISYLSSLEQVEPPLFVAARKDDIGAVKMLLKVHGANLPTYQGKSVVQMLEEKGLTGGDVYELLLHLAEQRQ